MNHEDDGGDVFAVVAGGFTGVDLDTPLDSVTARGRQLRNDRRKLTGAATMGVAAVAALAFALPGAAARPAAGQSARSAQPSVSRSPVNVRLAAWSMASNADGTVTLTFHDFTDLDQLRQALSQAGIHASVQGQLPTCGAGAPGVHGLPDSSVVKISIANDSVTEVINPAKMPAGSVLRIAGAPVPGARIELRGAKGSSPTPVPAIGVATDLFNGTPGPNQCVPGQQEQFFLGPAGTAAN